MIRDMGKQNDRGQNDMGKMNPGGKMIRDMGK